jgi:ribosomal protein S27E
MPPELVKAVETRYQGYRMRSRAEARFAVFLDALGVTWEYEIETADLGTHGWYLPDFWLPGLKAWIEIKGADPTFKEQQKARALAIQSRNPVYIFYGGMGVPTRADGVYFRVGSGTRALAYGAIPHCDWTRLPYPNYSFVWVECRTCQAVDIIGVGPALEVTKPICSCSQSVLTPSGPRLRTAYDVARSARFEHGESGGVR